MKTKDTEALGE